MLQAPRDRILVLGASQHKVSVHSTTLQALPHDVLEELTGTLPADRVSVENSNTWGADRPCLQDWTPLFQNAYDRFQLVLGDRERCALHGRNTLAGHGIAEIERRSDDYAGGAVDLLEQFVVHQHTAILGG